MHKSHFSRFLQPYCFSLISDVLKCYVRYLFGTHVCHSSQVPLASSCPRTYGLLNQPLQVPIKDGFSFCHPAYSSKVIIPYYLMMGILHFHERQQCHFYLKHNILVVQVQHHCLSLFFSKSCAQCRWCCN